VTDEKAINTAARRVAHAIQHALPYEDALAEYRAALAPVPVLRTRAEIDAEIVEHARMYHDPKANREKPLLFHHQAIVDRCAEPTRPDPAPPEGQRLTEAIRRAVYALEPMRKDTFVAEALTWLEGAVRDERRAQEQGEQCPPDCPGQWKVGVDGLARHQSDTTPPADHDAPDAIDRALAVPGKVTGRFCTVEERAVLNTLHKVPGDFVRLWKSSGSEWLKAVARDELARRAAKGTKP
jgi:hypothetical protein